MLLINVPRGTGEFQHGDWEPADWQAHLDYWARLNKGLKDSGELVTVEALAPPGAARLVRAGNDGAPLVTDGPFAESKEFLAGFWLVDVSSAARAHEIAARASAAPGPGGAPLGMPIEVRAVGQPPVDAAAG